VTEVADRAVRLRVELSDRRRLLLASFLMLFVELALIRWTAANNVHLIYLTNFVLLASFLGIGLGFLRGTASLDLFPWAPVALAGLVVFILAFPVSVTAFSGDRQLEGLFGLRALPMWLGLPVVFGLTVATMTAIAEEVARTFGRFKPLEAYRLDVLGSVGGIVAFSALSFLQLPPLAWGLLAALGFVVLLGARARRWQWGALGIVVLLLGVQSLLPIYHWSPYYKVRATERPRERALSVSANNVPHQVARPVEGLRTAAPFYFFPYRHTQPGALDEVLVIGAGTGNDVAVALSEGAGHVDAVEIDPALQRLGRDRQTRSRSSPVSRPLCGWRTTCSPWRPSSRSAPTSNPTACSPCTTTTSRGCCSATPARSPRSSVTGRAWSWATRWAGADRPCSRSAPTAASATVPPPGSRRRWSPNRPPTTVRSRT
jgi:hypothetical protein